MCKVHHKNINFQINFRIVTIQLLNHCLVKKKFMRLQSLLLFFSSLLYRAMKFGYSFKEVKVFYTVRLVMIFVHNITETHKILNMSSKLISMRYI